MIDPLIIPPVADEELLARFIVNGNEIRPDGTVTPKLFLPYKLVELSVNRHREATEEETWQILLQVLTVPTRVMGHFLLLVRRGERCWKWAEAPLADSLDRFFIKAQS